MNDKYEVSTINYVWGNVQYLTYHLRQYRLIIYIVITCNLTGVVAVLFDDLRKIVVYGIKFELLIPAPGDGFFQGFYGTAGPEYELVAVAAL